MAAAGMAGQAVESTPTIRDPPEETVEIRPPAVAAVGLVRLVETAVQAAAARALVEPLDL